MSNLQLKIEQALADVLSRDSELAQELATSWDEGAAPAGAERLAVALAGFSDAPGALGLVADKYRRARPVLTVGPRILQAVKPDDAESKKWQERLAEAGERMRRAIDAVGRIEVAGNGDLTVAGTAFMVGEDVIATNQHVAAQFAEQGDGSGFRFRLNVGGQEMEASVDFNEKLGVDESLEFRVVEVLHMEMDILPDVAFLRVARESRGRPLPLPLKLFTGDLTEVQWIAAIGYPQQDTREQHAAAMDAIFGDVYDKKRVSPGQVCRVDAAGRVVHDCSVLRGSSGSPLVDLKTGLVVGIHYAGEFLEDNLAVSGAMAQAVLGNVKTARPAAAAGHLPPDDEASADPVEQPRAA